MKAAGNALVFETEEEIEFIRWAVKSLVDDPVGRFAHEADAKELYSHLRDINRSLKYDRD